MGKSAFKRARRDALRAGFQPEIAPLGLILDIPNGCILLHTPLQKTVFSSDRIRVCCCSPTSFEVRFAGSGRSCRPFWPRRHRDAGRDRGQFERDGGKKCPTPVELLSSNPKGAASRTRCGRGGENVGAHGATTAEQPFFRGASSICRSPAARRGRRAVNGPAHRPDHANHDRAMSATSSMTTRGLR